MPLKTVEEYKQEGMKFLDLARAYAEDGETVDAKRACQNATLMFDLATKARFLRAGITIQHKGAIFLRKVIRY